jgi:hypothetical protein
LRKTYLAIIIFAAVGIGYTFATSKNLYVPTGTNSPAASSDIDISLSVEKPTVNYGDTQTWSVKGLPPNADYIATVRFADTALIVGTGRANANGEANGSFLIGQNIPPGTFIFKVEVSSDPAQFKEVHTFLAADI